MAQPQKKRILRHREETAQYSAGATVQFVTGTVVVSTSASTGVATTVVQLPSSLSAPPRSVGVILRLRVTTNSAANSNVYIHNDRANSGVTQAIARCVATQNNQTEEIQCIAPIVQGGVCYEMVTAATSADFAILAVGFLVA